MGCGTEYIEDKEFQDLSRWKNNGVTLETLRSRLKGDFAVDVRVYTVASTKLDKNVVSHLGSGPNLEGGIATLCTCKHSMRQNQSADWKGLWILGLTSRAINKGFNNKHYLFYMMKVDQAFKSHKELYEYLGKENMDALQIKNAVNNRLGDIFEPKAICTDSNSLKPEMYLKPVKNHSHAINGDTQWYDDIAYNGDSAPLLLGEKENTFVWTQPMIRFKQDRGVGNMKLTLKELFGVDVFLESV